MEGMFVSFDKRYIFTLLLKPKPMKNILIFTLLFVTGFAVQAQDMAKIEFKTEVIDYGDVKRGSDGVRIFEFTNTGNAPLVITEVNSTCGCTIPKRPENPISPGDTGEIQVKYDTQILGPIRKTITVYSNAEVPAKSVKIKGRVVE